MNISLEVKLLSFRGIFSIADFVIQVQKISRDFQFHPLHNCDHYQSISTIFLIFIGHRPPELDPGSVILQTLYSSNVVQIRKNDSDVNLEQWTRTKRCGPNLKKDFVHLQCIQTCSNTGLNGVWLKRAEPNHVVSLVHKRG